MRLLLLCCAPLAAGEVGEQDEPDPELRKIVRDVMRDLNAKRARLKLHPLEFNAAFYRRGKKHTTWMVLNHHDPRTQGLSAHDNSVDEEGLMAARRSSLASGTRGSPTTALDSWDRTFFHRISLYHPFAKECAFTAFRSNGRWAASLEIDLADSDLYGIDDFIQERFEKTIDDVIANVVRCPAPDSTDVPTRFWEGGELPSPLPQDAKAALPANPITISFYGRNHVSFELTLKTLEVKVGRRLAEPSEFWLSTPEKPAFPDRFPRNCDSVCVIFKKPLNPRTHHTVTYEIAIGEKLVADSWSFRTATH